jgi:hypothetical protein
MSERPWLEVSDPALRVERELLKRLNAEQPPAGSVDHGWAALSAEIAGLQAVASLGAGAGEAAHGAAHAAAGTTSVGLASKVIASVALAGGMLWGGSQLLAPDAGGPSLAHGPPPAESRHSSAGPVPEPMPVDALPTEISAAEPRAAVSPRPASSATTLAEEGRLLAKARQLVQVGHGQEALEVLRLSESRFPRSVLFQEREVVTIEALGATGSAAAAKQRAQRFLKRYPGSPYVERLQRFVE